MRSILPKWCAVSGVVLVWLVAKPAVAGRAEAQAVQLAEKAIYEDYLNLQFGPAQTKLKKALTLCETQCSAAVKARIFRDLGVVYLAGKDGKDAAIAAFIEALTADPKIRLDPDLTSDDMKQVFDDARKMVDSAATEETKESPGKATDEEVIDADAEEESATAKPEPKPEPEPEPEDTSPPEIEHTVPRGQMVNTPLPLFLEIAHLKPSKVGHVDLFYRPFGVKEFTKLPMRKRGDGWAAEIPCAQVGTTTGTLSYYFTVSDKSNHEIVAAGSLTKPFKTMVTTDTKIEKAHLPGEKPPAMCAAPADDCPPDFPGCGGGAMEAEVKEEEDEKPASNLPALWLSGSLQQDFLLLPKSSSACDGDVYGCYYDGGTFRDPVTRGRAGIENANGERVGTGTIGGGFTSATTRILIGADYAFTPHIVAGVKLGFAFFGGPQEKTPTVETAAFLPLHAEARVSYWFEEGIYTGQWRPYVQLSAGIAQVDAYVSVPIIDLAYKDECQQQMGGSSCMNRTVEAWRKTGTAFVSVGGGTVFSLGPDHGVFGELRVMQMFPASGTALGLQLGYGMAL